jgi:hypothetical protein
MKVANFSGFTVNSVGFAIKTASQKIKIMSFFRRFPSVLATIKSINIIILDGTTKATASLKLFNTVSSLLFCVVPPFMHYV